MARCFLRSLASLRGKKPPCWAVQLVSCGIGGALYVYAIFDEFFLITMSNEAHAFCHWVSVRCLWFSKMVELECSS